MSNTDYDDRDERGTALGEFARGSTAVSREVTIPQQGWNIGGDRVVGAQQVAVYRNTSKVLAELKALAAAVGDNWYYRYPVKNRKEGRTDWIEGPSIKLANDLARLYGNCDVDIRVVEQADSWVFYARFTDYETGFSLTRPFQQRKDASRMGGSDDARRLDIAFQIGVSKAERNVVVNALQTFSDYAYQEARGALVDKIGKDLQKYVEKTRSRLNDMGSDVLKRVEQARGRTIDKWLAPDVARTIAEIQSINDGMATAAETWSMSPPAAPSAPRADAPAVDHREAAGAEGVATEHTTAAPSTPPRRRGRPPRSPGSHDPGGTAEPGRGAVSVEGAGALSAAAPANSELRAEEEVAGPSEGRPDAPGGTATASSPPTATVTSPSPPTPLTAEQRVKLKAFGNGLASVNTPAAVDRGAKAFWTDNKIESHTEMDRVAGLIMDAHLRRARGELSISDADQVVRQALAL